MEFVLVLMTKFIMNLKLIIKLNLLGGVERTRENRPMTTMKARVLNATVATAVKSLFQNRT